ncbi:MAG: hypothetical protein BWK80_54345 [Desulfobacteraceae bacterium IS3]|nr:MAG: hypothetical protein BWK80_54345 [Desulfobacteraceae bacterium IS3]
MNENNTKVGILKKIKLSVTAGTSSDTADLTPQPFEFEFIFGLGKEGLTPFERGLADKTEGDEISLCLKPETIRNTFEHICFPLNRLSRLPASFFLKARVVKAVPAKSKDVIKGLAALASCGDHCCGDGCCHL